MADATKAYSIEIKDVAADRAVIFTPGGTEFLDLVAPAPPKSPG